ncbi:MAG: hypothetical protein JW841_14800 [Deltaproteobacteria bacterium]|nr:hypothetical protein [Deltaproteobacteria bacterium]
MPPSVSNGAQVRPHAIETHSGADDTEETTATDDNSNQAADETPAETDKRVAEDPIKQKYKHLAISVSTQGIVLTYDKIQFDHFGVKLQQTSVTPEGLSTAAKINSTHNNRDAVPKSRKLPPKLSLLHTILTTGENLYCTLTKAFHNSKSVNSSAAITSGKVISTEAAIVICIMLMIARVK